MRALSPSVWLLSCLFASHDPQRPLAQCCEPVWRWRRDPRLSYQMGEDAGKAKCECCGAAQRDEAECKCERGRIGRPEKYILAGGRSDLQRVRIKSERTEARAREKRAEDGGGRM
ncbi:hypothetical protein B0H13DRAFT_1898977 [Mycena leptocephala]|nr:hypothetical protein B0H13DRAFT_1898977 [Mycena leptocephala]